MSLTNASEPQILVRDIGKGLTVVGLILVASRVLVSMWDDWEMEHETTVEYRSHGPSPIR